MAQDTSGTICLCSMMSGVLWKLEWPKYLVSSLCLSVSFSPLPPPYQLTIWLTWAFSEHGNLRVIRLLPLWLRARGEQDKSCLSFSKLGMELTEHRFCCTLSVQSQAFSDSKGGEIYAICQWENCQNLYDHFKFATL